MTTSTIFTQAHATAKTGDSSISYRVRFAQALKAAWAAVNAPVFIEKGIFDINWSSINKTTPALELRIADVVAMTVAGSTGYVPVKGTYEYFKIEISSEIDGKKAECLSFLKAHFESKGIKLVNVERQRIN